MNDKEKKELIVKLAKCGFSITEAWNFLRSCGLVKPWVIIEHDGFGIINDYALQRINVV